MHKHTIETLQRYHCCRGKAISITYSECMSVALVISHAMRMHHIILSSVTRLALPYFSTVPHKRKSFRTQNMCFDFFTTLSETFLTPRNQRGIFINVHTSSGTVLVIPHRFLSNFFSTAFAKYSYFEFHGNPSSGRRVVPCGRTEGWTDTIKLIVAFRNFVNTSKNKDTHDKRFCNLHFSLCITTDIKN
jgi:hypothetical protein